MIWMGAVLPIFLLHHRSDGNMISASWGPSGLVLDPLQSLGRINIIEIAGKEMTDRGIRITN